MFIAREIWCMAEVSGVSPSSEQTLDQQGLVLYVYSPRDLVHS